MKESPMRWIKPIAQRTGKIPHAITDIPIKTWATVHAHKRARLVMNAIERTTTRPLGESLHLTPTQTEIFREILPAMYMRETIIQGHRRERNATPRIRHTQRRLVRHMQEQAAKDQNPRDFQRARLVAKIIAADAVYVDLTSYGYKAGIKQKVAATVRRINQEKIRAPGKQPATV